MDSGKSFHKTQETSTALLILGAANGFLGNLYIIEVGADGCHRRYVVCVLESPLLVRPPVLAYSRINVWEIADYQSSL